MLRIIRRFFGTIFATIGLVVVIGGIIGYIKFTSTLQGDPESDPVSDNMVIQLDVGGLKMVDFNLPSTLLAQLEKYRQQSLIEFIDLITEITQDNRVKAIHLNLSGTNFSTAQAEELRNALTKFKDSGKKIYTFAYGFGDGSNGTAAYYLASISDKIFMQPHGTVSIIGASLESYFLKDLLDDFDITVQAARRENYKGVVDQMTRADFTPEVKENLSTLVKSIVETVQTTTAGSRKIDLTTFVNLMNTAPHGDQAAIKEKLLDELVYRDQVREKIGEDLGGKPSFVTAKGYAPKTKRPVSKTKIGVIFLDSDVAASGTNAMNMNDPYSPDALDKAFEMATKEEGIKAILFRVNTPGGAVSGAETIYRAVKRTVDKGIPVVISMGTVAASAGYYMSAPATKIFANKTTITGSIGVAMAKPSIDKATALYGITWDRVQVGDNAGMWSITKEFSEPEWKFIEENIDQFYHHFIATVASGRKMSVDQAQAIAGGRVWSGVDAKHNGLVDEIGGFFEAFEETKKIAKIKEGEDPNVVIFNKVNPGLPLLFSLLGDEVKFQVSAILSRHLQTGLQSRLAYHVE
ncbi:MAG: signal peptide peptidase SppA [Candidatus Paracaedibacteraceae bacterium]|nr:signal peptide peptidase SppA [Candidatus Paracaedibacteraceae bacterium]